MQLGIHRAKLDKGSSFEAPNPEDLQQLFSSVRRLLGRERDQQLAAVASSAFLYLLRIAAAARKVSGIGPTVSHLYTFCIFSTCIDLWLMHSLTADIIVHHVPLKQTINRQVSTSTASCPDTDAQWCRMSCSRLHMLEPYSHISPMSHAQDCLFPHEVPCAGIADGHQTAAAEACQDALNDVFQSRSSHLPVSLLEEAARRSPGCMLPHSTAVAELCTTARSEFLRQQALQLLLVLLKLPQVCTPAACPMSCMMLLA